MRHASIRIGTILLGSTIGLTACAEEAYEPAGSGGAAAVTSSAAILTSWNEGAAKEQIVEFVERVTDPASPDFVIPEERIAVFDNDGTLWSEKPLYVQLQFALDRVKAMADMHPEWRETMPFSAILADDREALAGIGVNDIVRIVTGTHSGLTSDEFATVVSEWLATAKHPRYGVGYDELIYQPMVELLDYLRANGFKTYIVTGGGQDFVRTFAERAYGIPPEQVLGSSGDLEFSMRNGEPTLFKTAGIDFVDDGADKPVGIYRFIGRRPLLAFGNSDGDLQMLQYTAPGDRNALGGIVHHTDAEREDAYDADSHVGRLVVGLEEAPERGWVVVNMKDDWNKIFPSPDLP